MQKFRLLQRPNLRPKNIAVFATQLSSSAEVAERSKSRKRLMDNNGTQKGPPKSLKKPFNGHIEPGIGYERFEQKITRKGTIDVKKSSTHPRVSFELYL